MAPEIRDVLQVIQTIAQRELKMTRAIRLEDDLFKDLALDSVSAITLLVELENHFRVKIDDAGSQIHTVDHLARHVIEQVSRK